MSIKKMPNGKYKINIYLGKDPETGKQIRKVFHKNSYKAAKEIEKDFSAQKGQINTTEKLSTLGKVAEKYFNNLEIRNLKNNTINKYQETYETWIAPRFQFYKPEYITEHELERFFYYLRKNTSSGNLTFIMGRLNGLLTFAYKRGFIPRNPFDRFDLKIRIPARDRKVKYHSADEIRQILKTGYDKNYSNVEFIDLLYHTGLRVSEGSGLLCINWISKEKKLLVKYSLNKFRKSVDQKYDFELESLKGNESRSVFPPDHICKILDKNTKSRDPWEPIFSPVRAKQRKVVIDYDLISQRSIEAKFINSQEFSNDHFIPLQKKSDIENIISVHGTRHSFAVHFLASGGTLDELTFELGHKDPKTTLIYADYSDNYKRKNTRVDFTKTCQDVSRNQTVTNFVRIKGGKS